MVLTPLSLTISLMHVAEDQFIVLQHRVEQIARVTQPTLILDGGAFLMPDRSQSTC
jgi:hypothetical protein